LNVEYKFDTMNKRSQSLIQILRKRAGSFDTEEKKNVALGAGMDLHFPSSAYDPDAEKQKDQ
jgi:hypothetical protein